MTELLDPSRLHQLSAFRTQPVDRVVPVMRWSIDQVTGRPVANWALAPRQLSPDVQLRP